MPRVESCTWVYSWCTLQFASLIAAVILLFAFWYAMHEYYVICCRLLLKIKHTPHYLLSLVIKFEWMLLLFGLSRLDNWLQYANINFGCNEICIIYILVLRKYFYVAKVIWVSYRHVYFAVDMFSYLFYQRQRNVKEVWVPKSTPKTIRIIRKIIEFSVSYLHK